jgi:HEPN domain-containing protein
MLEMSKIVIEAFMKQALSDLDTAKLLKDAHKYSQSIYHLQQSFEKAIKSVYCYCKMKYDRVPELTAYNDVVNFGHNTKKSTLELLITISMVDQKVLLKNIPPEKMNEPIYQKMTNQLKQEIFGYITKIENLRNQKETDLRILLKTYPSFVQEMYQKYQDNLSLIKKLEPEIIAKYNFSIKNISTRSHSFLIFVNSACLLYPCLSKMESVTRYPDKKFQHKNIELLNMDDVKKACDYIIKMLDGFIDIASKTVKEGR